VVGQRIVARAASQARWVRIARASLGVVIGLYALVAAVWYVGLLRLMSEPIDLPRGGVRVSRPLATSLLRQVRDIRARTRADEPVLSVPDLAILNFLAERPYVGRIHEMYEHMIGDDRGQSIVDAAEAREVAIAVARFNDFFSHRVGLRSYAPPLASYLRSHFRPAYYREDENFMLLERRDEPLSIANAASALASCDAGRGKMAPREVERHLLFDALYHRILPDQLIGKSRSLTRCHLLVPDRAALRVEVGYRPPERAEPDATLTVFVWAQQSSQTDDAGQLLRETFEVGVHEQSQPFVLEREVDLSHLAGREISLLFGTEYHGRVTPREDYFGFSAVFLDPLVVHTAADQR
jgi:hypothetical protein